MRSFLGAVALCFCLLNAACDNRSVRVEAGAVPNISPNKTDSVFFDLAPNSSIRDRQLYPIALSELRKNGFNVADDIKTSTWTLILGSGAESYVAGIGSNGVSIPIGSTAVSFANSSVKYANMDTISLSLFKTSDLESGKAHSVWDGSATVKKNVYEAYTKTIIKNLLDEYGKTYSGDNVLEKSYQYAK